MFEIRKIMPCPFRGKAFGICSNSNLGSAFLPWGVVVDSAIAHMSLAFDRLHFAVPTNFQGSGCFRILHLTWML